MWNAAAVGNKWNNGKHLGKTECFSYYKSSAGFIPENYIAHFKDADVNTGEYATGKRE